MFKPNFQKTAYNRAFSGDNVIIKIENNGHHKFSVLDSAYFIKNSTNYSKKCQSHCPA